MVTFSFIILIAISQGAKGYHLSERNSYAVQDGHCIDYPTFGEELCKYLKKSKLNCYNNRRNFGYYLRFCCATCKAIACDCHEHGSLNAFCEVNKQCPCKTGYQGLKCDSCAYGYFGFPNCQRKNNHNTNCQYHETNPFYFFNSLFMSIKPDLWPT